MCLAVRGPSAGEAGPLLVVPWLRVPQPGCGPVPPLISPQWCIVQYNCALPPLGFELCYPTGVVQCNRGSLCLNVEGSPQSLSSCPGLMELCSTPLATHLCGNMVHRCAGLSPPVGGRAVPLPYDSVPVEGCSPCACDVGDLLQSCSVVSSSGVVCAVHKTGDGIVWVPPQLSGLISACTEAATADCVGRNRALWADKVGPSGYR